MYQPKPIDTGKVQLPEEIRDLTELLAANAHEIWAKQRIDQGWAYGDRRDDEKKTTPCLVPYEELPEAEKDYDRFTAMETLRLILTLGYRITRTEAQNGESDGRAAGKDVDDAENADSS